MVIWPAVGNKFSKEREKRILSSYQHCYFHVCGVLPQADLYYCHWWIENVVVSDDEEDGSHDHGDSYPIDKTLQASIILGF